MPEVPSPPVRADQESALQLFRERQSFLLVGHVRPDGDCVGSQGALARVLASLGKQVVIMNPDHPGEQFGFFYDHCPFQVHDSRPLPDHDVCVLLDINDLGRCGKMTDPLAAHPSLKVVVDHHPFEGEPWWDASFVDTSASATGILVWRLSVALGARVDDVAASALFTSLVSDTGWFRYSNTDVETMTLAAELMTRPSVRPAELFRTLHQRDVAEQPRALARVLAETRYYGDGRLAVVQEGLAAPGDVVADSDAVLDIVRAVGDVEVVLYLRQLPGGLVKLSARSKTDFDVNRLARGFGGGGHAKAAGAAIEGGLDDVRERLVAAALETLGAVGREPA